MPVLGTGPFGDIWKAADEQEMLLSLAAAYLGLHRLDDACNVFKGLLRDRNNDDWHFLSSYLDVQMKRRVANTVRTQAALLEFMAGSFVLIAFGELPQDLREEIVAETLGFLKSLQESSRGRGPYLAELHLYHRLAEEQDDEDQPAEGKDPTAELNRLLQEYYVMFGNRPCFFGDVQSLLPRCDLSSLERGASLLVVWGAANVKRLISTYIRLELQ